MSTTNDNSTITVRRLMNIHEFRQVTGISESTIRHNTHAFEHLMVKTPARRIIFDSVKVAIAIQKGDLTK